MSQGQGSVSYSPPPSGSAGSGTVTGGDNGLSASLPNIVLGQDVGQAGNPAALISNREIPRAGFNLGFDGTGTLVVGGSIANQTPPTPGIAVFFGDSITVGVGASSTANRWTSIFSSIFGYTESNLGLTGTYLENQTPVTANNMVSRIPAIPTKTSGHTWLVFAYGINDALLNAPNYTTANFTTDYNTVIAGALAKGWTAASIILIGTTWKDPATYQSVMGFPASNQARQISFNTAIQSVAAAAGCLFIPMYAPMQARGGDLLITASDNLHPNDGGYRVMALNAASFITTSYTAGQQLLVKNGLTELESLKIDNMQSLLAPISVLGQDGAGNVAPTTLIVGNQLDINNQAAIGNGAYSTEPGETLAIYGGTRSGYLRTVESVANPSFGKAMTMGMYPSDQHAGMIDCYDDSVPGGIPLFINWHGGHINLGGLGVPGQGEAVAVAGTLQASNSLRATGASNTTAGAGIEMFYDVGHVGGDIWARDKTGATTLPIALNFDGGGAIIICDNADSGFAFLQIRASDGVKGPLQLRAGNFIATPKIGLFEFQGTSLAFTRNATRLAVFTGINGAAAPATNVLALPGNVFGSSATLMGQPAAWADVDILGTSFKIPLY